jgi:hypothetical protein
MLKRVIMTYPEYLTSHYHVHNTIVEIRDCKKLVLAVEIKLAVTTTANRITFDSLTTPMSLLLSTVDDSKLLYSFFPCPKQLLSKLSVQFTCLWIVGMNHWQ